MNKLVGSFLLCLTGLCLNVSYLSSQVQLVNPDYLPPEYHNRDQIESEFRNIIIELPFTTIPQSIRVELVDDFVIFQGDIIIGTEVGIFGQRAAATIGNRWNDATIPYEIQDNHPLEDIILDAIRHVNDNTNLCLVARNGHQDYVQFVEANGCSSWVGRQGGRLVINIGNCPFGSIVQCNAILCHQ